MERAGLADVNALTLPLMVVGGSGCALLLFAATLVAIALCEPRRAVGRCIGTLLCRRAAVSERIGGVGGNGHGGNGHDDHDDEYRAPSAVAVPMRVRTDARCAPVRATRHRDNARRAYAMGPQTPDDGHDVSPALSVVSAPLPLTAKLCCQIFRGGAEDATGSLQ